MPGTHLEHQMQLKLGRLSLAMLKGIAGAAIGDDPDARTALAAVKGIKRFELATYEVHGTAGETLTLRLEAWFGKRGWQPMVRVRGEEDLVWVLYRERDARMRNLWMVFLDGEELAVIRIDGNLNDMVSAVLELALSGIDAGGNDPGGDVVEG